MGWFVDYKNVIVIYSDLWLTIPWNGMAGGLITPKTTASTTVYDN